MDTSRKKAAVVSEVVGLVKRDLVMGRLVPGEHISEDSLIYRLNIKRNAARDALAELHRQGVIEIAPFRGAYVRRLSPVEVHQIFDTLRYLYRAWGDQISAPLGDATLAELERRCRVHGESLESDDPEAIYIANASFHEALLATIENRFLADVIARTESHMHNVRYHMVFSKKEYIEKGRADHQEMVAALRQGDGIAFENICIEHMAYAGNFYKNVNAFIKDR